MNKFLLFVALLINSFAFAQTQHRICGSMENLDRLKQEDPDLALRMQQIETQTAVYLQQHNTQNSPNMVITIPVVFHVVYNTTAQNVSDAKCMAQINQLNLDYARLNADRTNTPTVWQGIAVNTQIQFCLAQRDPAGAATTGVERKQTTTTSFSTNDNVKKVAYGGLAAWPSGSYLNIWTCNLSNGILGYAQFPAGAAATDGVVLHFETVGSVASPGPSSAAPYNLGRTATHEVGHWLNLYHIWGDESQCSGTDNVGDTPNQGPENYGCPSFPKVDNCQTASPGVMFMNYMDYTDDNCMNMFTAGQSSRMNALFATGGSRVSLLSSIGCQAPSTTCGVPAGMNTTSITTSGATLNWTAVSGATSYNLQYKISTATSWTTTTATTNSKVISGLTAGTNYQWQVQAVCAAGTSSFGAITSFTTLSNTSCGTPSGLTATSITGSSAILNWTAVTGATSYNIQYKVSTATTWNLTTSTTNSKSLSGLVSGTTYQFQVQTVCAVGSSSYSAIASFTTVASTTCGVPTGLNTTNVTTGGAKLNWTAVTGAISYGVQYKTSASASWITSSSTTNSLTLAGLSAGTIYQWQVRTICSSGNSAFSAIATFTTIATSCTDAYEPNNTYSVSSALSVNSTISALISTSTDIDWYHFTTASPYTKLKITLTNLAGDYDIKLYNSSLTLLAVSQNSGTTGESIIYNSTAGATYYINVYGYNGASSGTQCYNLRANVSSLNFKVSGEADEISVEETGVMKLYPNPVRDNINVSFTTSVEEKATIRIFDMVGKTAFTTSVDLISGENKFNFDLSTLSPGIYFTELQNSTDRVVTKFILEK